MVIIPSDFPHFLNFQIRQIPVKGEYISGNSNPFSIRPAAVRIKTSES